MALFALLRRFAGLIFPVFAKVGDFRIPSAVKWFLHFMLLGLILAGLWYLNNRVPGINVQKYVPVSNHYVRNFYLPILFGLIYLLCWFVWWVWKLLGPDEETSDFPDIDDAWFDGAAALAAANISLADVPIFLVLGRPASGPDGLFQAPGMNLPVRPRSLSAPVQVWGGPDAVFVCAPGASIGGEFASRVGGGPVDDAPPPMEDPTDAALATIGLKSIGVAGDKRSEIQVIMQRAHAEGRELTSAEKDRLRQLTTPGGGKPRSTGRTLLSSEDMNLASARLRHLCRRIAADREPFCPANGILVLIPWAATDNNESADEAALVVQRDLVTAREGLQLFCPVIAMFCDLERARGFREFRHGFPGDQVKRRLGQRLPLAPDAAPNAIPDMFEVGAKWVGEAIFPTWVFKMLTAEPEPDGPRTESEVDSSNRNLHALLREVRLRYPRLGRILAHGAGAALSPEEGLESPPLFGGCYIAGTGKSPDEQAFVPGVLQRLVEGQSYVAWTPDVFADDDWYRRNTRMGYVALVLFAIGVIGASVWYFALRK
ncbi:MAG: type VI secretion protein IcmF/TssM N-terminal domain-containing protein [Gemmataceae bacterium]